MPRAGKTWERGDSFSREPRASAPVPALARGSRLNGNALLYSAACRFTFTSWRSPSRMKVTVTVSPTLYWSSTEYRSFPLLTGFPLMAKRNGARLVILNRDATEFDNLADLVIHHDIGTVLAPFVAH